MAYLLWFLTLSVGMLAVLEVRNVLNAVWPVLGSGIRWAWTLRAADRFGLVFLGLVWLSYEILAEYRYRLAITAVRVRQFRGKRRQSWRVSGATGLCVDLHAWGWTC